MTDTPIVAGLDLSLTSTGLAVAHGDTITVSTVTSSTAGNDPIDRHARLRKILDGINTAFLKAAHCTPDLVVIEGPSYGSPGRGAWDRGGLWWLVLDDLIGQSIPLAVAPPACRAKYATGNGQARKPAVVAAAARRYPNVEITTDDEVDAVVLAAMGRDHLGAPVVDVPKTHRAALDKVAWPALTTARSTP